MELKKRTNLIDSRKKLGFTQEEMAIELEIATITLRKLENGSGTPSSRLAVKIANLTKRRLEFLFPDIFLLNFDTKSIQNV